MLTVSTWLWGDKYTVEDVMKLRRGIARHLTQPHRFLVMTEREREWEPPESVERHAIKDPDLLRHKGCFARLRMFDSGWQKNRGIDDRLVCLDLDVIIVGPLDPLFDRPERFVILAGANSRNPCPYNGSVIMLRPGHNEIVWSLFSYEAACKLKFYEYPDDQGWLAHMLPNEATWQCGRKSGIYGFMKPGWITGDVLPEQARIVAFPGARQPSNFMHLDWVKRNWV